MTDDERLRKWLDAAVESAYRAGAEQERAAVVAWLRDEMHHGWEADAVERGEHRREEEK